MSDLEELTEELLLDPEFQLEYDAIQTELDHKRAIMDADIAAGKGRDLVAEQRLRYLEKHRAAAAPSGRSASEIDENLRELRQNDRF